VLIAAWLTLCALVLGTPELRAQEANVQASVDRSTIRDNESLTYTIRVEGAVRDEPEIGPLAERFDVLARSSSSRIQILNGQTSQVTEWQFQLMPKAAAGSGELTVPSLRVGRLATNPLTVRVLPPEAGTGEAPADIFMEVEAEPSTVYVQSQVVFTLRLFVGVATGRATLTPPEIAGGEAIIEKLGEDGTYQTTRGGRTFSVRERRYAIFPQQAGSLTVGPATFEAMVIPDRGFSRVARFRSDALTFEVQPAVPPPASMANAAWLPAQNITLSEAWSDDADELPVGTPRTHRVVLEATGLLETQLPEVQPPAQPGIRQYASQPELTREITSAGFRTRRSVSLTVIAQTPGEVTLAPVRVPWFNVGEQRWEVAELPSRTLRVTPSGEPPPVEAAPAEAVSAAPQSAPEQGVWTYVSAGLALAWLATMGLWWRSRRAATAARARSAPQQDARTTARKALRELQAACSASNADAARRALLAWGEQRFPAAPPRSLGALAALLPEGPARQVLDLEAHLYGAAAGAWDGGGLAAVLAELEEARSGSLSAEDEPLMPLYR
jgi:hypothetical protein